ncbi:hypothetical protein CU633_05090 [Bacillus sp. V3-13]|uniref:hypothetical protein n=1 Tax=Bacillus sp. V3-13 TaxID=2053728 RepID=UPI000C75A526|nr:hypothetical protein [Bacillus sp. V3-13]PLR78605.1 hypothetical protein CU633_05090 [Bacillus sp. V3-13]
MDKRLENLNEKMNETLLKDIRFEEKHKQNVLKAINKFTIEKPKREKLSLQSKVNMILSASVLCIFLAGIIHFTAKQINLAQEDQPDQQAIISEVSRAEYRGVNMKQDYMQYKQSFWYDDLKYNHVLAQQNPDKFSILKKLYFSSKYIHNAHGEFEFSYSDPDNIQRVQFYADFDNGKNRTKYEEYQGSNLIASENSLLKNGTLLRQNPEKNIYNKKVITGNDYFLGYSQYIFDSEWFILLRNNYTDWEYREAEQFGMPVYEIDGEISESISQRLAGPFTMTVSKDTGALLDLKCYGKGNEPIVTVTVKNISINKGVPEDVFHLEVSGVELPNFDYNIADIENYQEKTGGMYTSNSSRRNGR